MWKCLEVITLQPRERKRTPSPHCFLGEKLATAPPWNLGTDRRLFREAEKRRWSGAHRWLRHRGPSSIIIMIVIPNTMHWPLALSEKHFISKIALNSYSNTTKTKSVAQSHPGSGRAQMQNQAQAKFLSWLLTYRIKTLLRGFRGNSIWFAVP